MSLRSRVRSRRAILRRAVIEALEPITLLDGEDMFDEAFHYQTSPQSVTFQAAYNVDQADGQNLTTGQPLSVSIDNPDAYSDTKVTFPTPVLGIGNYQIAYFENANSSNSTSDVNYFVDDGRYIGSNNIWFLPGDVNRDRVVDSADQAIITANLNTTNKNFSQGDVNFDHQVNAADSAVLTPIFGVTLHEPPPDVSSYVVAQTLSSSSVAVNWGAAANPSQIDGYHIFRAEDGGAFTQIGQVGRNVTHYSDTGLKPGWKYLYRVRAYTNAGGNSASPNRSTTATVLDAPTIVDAEPLDDGSIRLNIDDHATRSYAGTYIEIRPGDSTDDADWTVASYNDPGDGDYEIVGLTPGESYQFRAQTNNDYAQSAYSQTVSCENITPLPSGFTATAVSSSQINLHWNSRNATDPDRLISVFADGSTTPCQTIQTGGGMTSKAIIGLNEGHSYTFKLATMVDGYGWGEPAVATARTLSTAPVGLPSTLTQPDHLALSWIDASRTPTHTVVSKSTDGLHFSALVTLGAGVTTYSAMSLLPNQPYTFKIDSDYTYSIDGGSVGGSITHLINYDWTHSSTAANQVLITHQSSHSSWSEAGSYSTTTAGVTTSGTISQNDTAINSTDVLALAATLVNGAWVWSGNDSGTWDDPGSWSYSETKPYSYVIDGGVVSGTTTASGGGHWSAGDNWTQTLQPDGTWQTTGGSAHAKGDQHDNFDYFGGGHYHLIKPDLLYDGDVSEDGGDHSTSKYDTSSSVINGAWVNSGSSSGTWNNYNDWNDSGQGQYLDTFTGGSMGGTVNADDGEEYDNSGAWGETLNTVGQWILTSGGGTTTNHLHGDASHSGNGEYSSTSNTQTDDHLDHLSSSVTGTVTEDGDENYDNKITLHSNLQGGQWVETGTAVDDSGDSGDWSTDGDGDYSRTVNGSEAYWVSGTNHGGEQQSWSSHFTTNSVLHSDGSVTKTGTGNSDDAGQSDFGFSGGGAQDRTTSEIDPVITTDEIQEQGSSHGDGDLYSDWVLDPDGKWRAATTQQTTNGTTQAQVDNHHAGHKQSGDVTVGMNYHRNSNFHFSNQRITATDSAGQKTISGSGSGGGNDAGTARSLSVTRDANGMEQDSSDSGDYIYQGGWNENYAAGTATASGANHASTTWLVIHKHIGEVTDQDAGGTDQNSTTPGFVTGDTGVYNMATATFETFGTPGFGRSIPSVTVQTSSQTITRHGGYNSHPEAITTPTWVTTTSITLGTAGVLLTGGAIWYGLATGVGVFGFGAAATAAAEESAAVIGGDGATVATRAAGQQLQALINEMEGLRDEARAIDDLVQADRANQVLTILDQIMEQIMNN